MHRKNEENTLNLLRAVIEKSNEFNGQNLRILKVTEHCSFADYFVILSGQSTVQIQALAEALVLHAKHQGFPALSIEGLAQGTWCLLDFGDVIVHVFNEDKRQIYGLESLWRQAELVSLDRVQDEA